MKTIKIEKKVRLEPHHLEKITQKRHLVKEIHIFVDQMHVIKEIQESNLEDRIF